MRRGYDHAEIGNRILPQKSRCQAQLARKQWFIRPEQIRRGGRHQIQRPPPVLLKETALDDQVGQPDEQRDPGGKDGPAVHAAGVSELLSPLDQPLGVRGSSCRKVGDHHLRRWRPLATVPPPLAVVGEAAQGTGIMVRRRPSSSTYRPMDPGCRPKL